MYESKALIHTHQRRQAHVYTLCPCACRAYTGFQHPNIFQIITKGLARPIESKGKRNIYPSCVTCQRLLEGFSFIIPTGPTSSVFRPQGETLCEATNVWKSYGSVGTARRKANSAWPAGVLVCHLEKVSVESSHLLPRDGEDHLGAAPWGPSYFCILFTSLLEEKNCLAILLMPG